MKYAWWVVVALAWGCASGGSNGRGDAGTGGRDGGGDRDGSTMPSDGAVDAPAAGDCASSRDGTPCNADDDGCTMDLCRAGVCVVEGEADCNDGVSCTIDTCRSTGSLTFTCDRTVTEGCFLDGECVAAGAVNPSATCQSCNPASPTTWTESTGTCDDGDACTENDTCTGGNCVGTPLLDDYEPNETSAAAESLGSVDDDDSFPKGTVVGSFYPVGDVDWYRYRDNDIVSFGSIFPRSQLQNIPSGFNFDLCVFLDCTDGTTADVSCTSGAPSTFEGLPGCCSRSASNADENVRINHTCGGGGVGSDDTVDVYVRVENVGPAASCEQSYRLRWGDD
ncbi:MAG: hypothetical protein H6721_08330 [Sandaracinus sp.]|nr:hypothetical protein [Sandaracinus sp.]MCB9617067.1 hypothetical protein [Sandaracinus sp.]MCB9623496.1 hypothetical protein [Sandaracinus sp.]MCB9632122.1 hypothetical protein [Sandaracinus sp.]